MTLSVWLINPTSTYVNRLYLNILGSACKFIFISGNNMLSVPIFNNSLCSRISQKTGLIYCIIIR